MIRESDKLKSFEIFRKESIDLLEAAILDKDSFLSANLDYIEKLDLKPFTKIENLDQAIYNYQYYNLYAKKTNMEAAKIIHNTKKKKQYLKLINQRENYYHLKDIATLRILELVDYKEIESYFIILRSKRLAGEIFEIYIKNMDKMILHSKDRNILQNLKDNEVFNDTPRPSLIDTYVNKSY